MKFFASKIYQRVSLFSLSILLAASTLMGIGSLLLDQTANAVSPSEVVYNALPSVTPSTNYASLGYEATSTSEFGDYVHLGGTNRVLNTVTVTMSDWAKYSDYSTNPTYDSNTSTWSLPVTLNVYSSHLGANGAPDTILATKTQTVAIPWRPESDSNCAATSNGNGWSVDGTCYNFSGIASNITFDLSSLDATLPNDVILGVAYNTEDHGYAPTGVAGPYDSLNVAIPDNQPVTVGSDDNTDDVFFNTSYAPFYTDGGTAGTNIFRQDTNWGVNGTVAFEITATAPVPPSAPTSLTFQDGSTTIPSGSVFNNTSITNNTDLVWTTGSEATDAYQTEITYPDGSTNTLWTSTKNLWIGHTPYLDNLFGEKGDGVYSYRVEARSAVSGLWSDWSSSVNLIYDTTAPVVTVTPIAGSLLHGSETFHITVTDANLNPDILKHVYVYLYNNNPPQKSQGASVDLSSGSADFTVDTTNLADGLATLDVGKLFDAAGNASGVNDSYFKNYTIDNTAPAVPTLLSPANGIHRTTANTNSSSWSTVTDPNGPVTYYYESAFDSAFTNIAYGPHAQTTTSILNPGEPEGTYYWRVQACDSLGNCSAWSSPWTINIDNTAPTGLLNLSPSDGTIITTAGLTSIDWTDASDTSGPVSYYYESSHSSATNPDGSFVSPVYTSGALSTSQIPTTGTPEGIYYWHVRAVDSLGNSTGWTSPWEVTVDDTAPVVAITAPGDGDTLKGSVTVSGTVTDTNPDHYYFVVKDSHGNVVAGPGTVNQATVSDWTWDTTAVADGLYTIDLEARDAAGNKDANSVRTISVTVDNTAPVVSITAPTAGNYGFINTVNVDADIDDAVSYSILVNGSDVFDGTGAYVPYALSVVDGTYTIQVKATDAVGNVGTSAVTTVNVDDTAPVLTVSGYNGTSLTPTITGTTDNATDVVTVDGVAATVSTTVNTDGTYDWSLTLPTQTIGTHTISVVSTDTYGNATTEPATVTVNAVPATDTTPATTATTVTPTGTTTTNTANQGVLGASTTTPNSTSSDTSTPAVLGTSTTNKSSTPWSLAWYWWILIIAALAALLWAIIAAIRRRSAE